MNNTQLKEFIAGLVADAIFEEGKQFLAATVTPAQAHNLIEKLKTDPSTRFDFLMCQSGVDYQDKLGVVYHLESTSLKHQVVVKTATTDRENPVLDSIFDLYKVAELHENEIYDLLGIKFKGHPNLRRMFMPDDWNGFPLRKDYVDEVNIIDLD